MKKIFAAVVLVTMLAASSWGTVGYLPMPNVRFWDSTGTRLLTGGYVVTCPPGTTCGCTSFTAKTTYTDSTGLVANNNPVLLDSTGSASIWYDGTAAITACDRYGVLQWSRDNVSAVIQPVTSSVSEWVAVSLTPTYLNSTQFSVIGDATSIFTTGRRLQIVQGTGTIYATVSSSLLSLGATTVTIVFDTTAIDSSISSIYVGILEPTYRSLPVIPVINKTTGYTITADDCGKTFISNLSSAASFTLSAANTVPSGCIIVTKSTGSNTTIGGTVDGIVNPVLSGPNSVASIFSNGVAWKFNSFITSNTYPYSNTINDSNGYLPDGWSGLISMKVLTTGTVYTPSTGVRRIIAKIIAGGGAGGSATVSVAGHGSAGGGGGSGSYAEKLFSGISGTTCTYSIGAAGSNSSMTCNGVTITTNGGGAGENGTDVSSTYFFAGGAGGSISTNGDINLGGWPGGNGSTNGALRAVSGQGASSVLGGGGDPLSVANSVSDGNASTGYGSGGSGAARAAAAGTGTSAGGAGSPGAIVILEFN